MKDKLVIENFGPIKKVELDLKKINVFIGPNASGKSTIVKILSIVKDINFLTDLMLEKETKSFNDYNIENYYNSDSKFYYENDDYFVSFKGGKIEYDVFENERYLKYLSDLDKYPEKEKNNIEKDFKNEKSPLVKKILGKVNNMSTNDKVQWFFIKPMLQPLATQIFNIPFNLLYIPTERIFITGITKSLFGFASSNINLQKNIVNFGAKYEKAKSKISKTEINFMGVTYFQENNEEYIVNKNNKIVLNETSSGIQSVIPLVLALMNSSMDDATFVIEEPELNLFPDAQKGLVNFLIENTYKNDNSLTINTHSPYILMALNNLIEANNTLKELKEKGLSNDELNEYENKIKEIVKSKELIDFDDIAVYYIHSDGTAEDIKDYENRLINAEKIDSVSDIFADEVDALLEMTYGK